MIPTYQSKDKFILYLLVLFFSISVLSSQLGPNSEPVKEDHFTLYNYAYSNADSIPIKTILLAKNPYKDLLDLKKRAKVLFVTSAAFTFSLDVAKNINVGFCSEEGEVLNKMSHSSMDGLFILNSNHSNLNDVRIIDLDEKTSDCRTSSCKMHLIHNNIRDSFSDTFPFLEYVKNNQISSFQTQLVYTNTKTDIENFKSLTNGTNDRKRRFMAICKVDGTTNHVIIDCSKEDYLMKSAKEAIS